MTQKTTSALIIELATLRNHEVVNMKNYRNVHSKILFFCKTCENNFETTLHSYKNAKKTGCSECKKQLISSVQKKKKVSKETKLKIGKANTGKVGSLKGKAGEHHPRWKGGSYTRILGSSTEAYLWRQAVIDKYSGKCFLTGALSNLECHHLNSWDSFPEKRSCIQNEVLITKTIHKKFHQKYGYGKNTEKQFAEFCFTCFNLDWTLFRKNLEDNTIISSQAL
uniref:Putative site-specific DNA endonuclease n=1 Tax=Tupiella akineta TaxID=160070 RepID=Q3ZJ54_TUPAK|nr:putative site-specific DNA endonuclease [Tupiella akineta]AAV80637.1 putative site-specific DNA endonuclease [Tupiella akineta]